MALSRAPLTGSFVNGSPLLVQVVSHVLPPMAGGIAASGGSAPNEVPHCSAQPLVRLDGPAA
jgi:hypothetical protein